MIVCVPAGTEGAMYVAVYVLGMWATGVSTSLCVALEKSCRPWPINHVRVLGWLSGTLKGMTRGPLPAYDSNDTCGGGLPGQYL